MRNSTNSKKYLWISPFFLVTFLYLSFNLFAETIVLKSGQTREGKILEQTDKYIKIDFFGTPLTYFLEDIERVEGKEIKEVIPTQTAQPKKEDQLLPLALGNTWHYSSSVISSPGKEITEDSSQSVILKIVGKEFIDGKEVFVQEKYDQKGNLVFKEYLSYRGNSLLCHKKEIHAQDGKIRNLVFTPPQIYAKSDAQPGEELTESNVFVGKAEVQTVAGKFKAYEFVTNTRPESQAKNREVHRFYSPGIGLVREVRIIKSDKQERKVKDDLVKYTLSDTDNPQ